MVPGAVLSQVNVASFAVASSWVTGGASGATVGVGPSDGVALAPAEPVGVAAAPVGVAAALVGVAPSDGVGVALLLAAGVTCALCRTGRNRSCAAAPS